MPTPLYRHGDVLIALVPALPLGARPRPDLVLAPDEFGGHRHRVAEPTAARLFSHGDLTFLQVTAERATVIHEDHRPIELPRGTYRVWQQREYTPERVRIVLD
ncbi:hypothetical protein [Deinococcus yavapaiensis]|uniref:Uncharacterized protein n=1 Tax=Deinococcus yavapaiensis KR-236 TaxID=694435 RepID=A0A318S6Y2_9DEIO|nr:hypothetical protein [Deinococcus yavapaiensis]PYE52809.1 hypothetical protein DES52_112130 [Deinococcus yavapaiensis KR-236]